MQDFSERFDAYCQQQVKFTGWSLMKKMYMYVNKKTKRYKPVYSINVPMWYLSRAQLIFEYQYIWLFVKYDIITVGMK